MTTQTQSPENLHGVDVMDASRTKLGTVDGVWVDEATGNLEFITVKTGWLMGRSYVMPTAEAQIAADIIHVPYSKDQMEGAPSFDPTQEMSPDDEAQIYQYYGIERSTAPSPTGLPSGGTRKGDGQAASARGQMTDRQDSPQTGEMPTDPTHVTVPLSEETLRVGTRQVEAGQVRIRKVVQAEQVNVPVELRHEDIEIQRVAASNADVPATAFQEEDVSIPLMKEEAVVGKQAQVIGQVQVNKRAEIGSETVHGEIRREDVEIDQGTVDEYVHTPEERARDQRERETGSDTPRSR